MTVDWSILSNPIVVSIVGGSVGWSLSQFTNRKRMKHEKEINDMKLKADVVVKSRMEWIKEVRELSINRYNSESIKIVEEITEIDKLFAEKTQTFNKIQFKFISYFLTKP